MDKTTLNRRDFLRISAVTAAGVALASCAPGTPEPVDTGEEAPAEAPPAAEKVQLVFQNRAVEEGAIEARQNTWKEAGPKFQEKYPDIEVEFRNSPAEHWDKLVASFAAGTSPDIYELCCTNSYKVIEMEQALNVQPFIDVAGDELDMDDFYPDQFKPWTSDAGDIHAMPRDSGAMVIYYNVDMFEEMGVDPLPKDYENNIDHQGYDEIGLKFVRREQPLRWATTNYGLGADWLLQYHLWAWGANMVDPDDRDVCVLDTKEALECLEWCRAALWDKHTFAVGSTLGDVGPGAALRGGQTAMMEMGPWNLLPQTEVQFKWDLAPLPDGPAGHTGFNSVDCYQGWSGTKDPDATWSLLSFLSSPDHTKPYCRYTYRQPCLNSLHDFWVTTMRENEPELETVNMELYAKARQVGHPEEMFHNDGICKGEILQPAFDRIMLQGTQPVDYILPFIDLVNEFNAGTISNEDIGSQVQDLLEG